MSVVKTHAAFPLALLMSGSAVQTCCVWQHWRLGPVFKKIPGKRSTVGGVHAGCMAALEAEHLLQEVGEQVGKSD